ncbi:MAG: peroxiredoxin family protein [Pseudomonadota bacterium]
MIRSFLAASAATSILLSGCAQEAAPTEEAEADVPAAQETVETVAETTTEPQAPAIGPAVGSKAPAISATLIDGSDVDLSGISGREGAVLVFSRSLDWCPFCKTQANDLEAIASDLAEAGYPLSLITYDNIDVLNAYALDAGLTYTLLSDENSSVIDGFNLRNADVLADSRFDGIPHPAVIFVSTDGTVEAVLREDGYRTRPSNEAILAELESLTSAE